MREIATWPEGREFETLPSMTRITLGAILRAVFGAEGPALDELRDLVPPMVALASLFLAVPPSMRRDLGPWSPWGRHLRYRRRFDAVIDSLIADARADPALEERSDVLALLVQARYENGEPIPDQHIADEMLTLLASGHETTAGSLAWAVERLTPPSTAAVAADRGSRRRRIRIAAGHDRGSAAHPAGSRRHRAAHKDANPLGGLGHSGEHQVHLQYRSWSMTQKRASRTRRRSTRTDSSAASRSRRVDSVRRRRQPLRRRGVRHHGDGRHPAHTAARIPFRANRCAGRTTTLARCCDRAGTGRTSGGLPANRQGVA